MTSTRETRVHDHGRRVGGGRWRRRAAVLLAGALALVVLASACSGSSHGSSGAGATSPSPSPTLSAARITISPPGGSRQAKTAGGISVTVRDGTLVSVTATKGGGRIAGELSAGATSWHSTWTLATDARYVVRATAVDADGRTVTRTSRFHTLVPHTTASVQIFQGYHVTYGVGMPVMLAFSRPVQNKAAVEKALELTCSRKVIGAWYWDGDQALWFRPRGYWPDHVDVSFTGHLDGVQLSPGVYATHTLSQTWSIGRSLIAVASASGHQMKLYKDGKLYATWPISTGMPGKDTPNGTYLSIEKANPQRMVGPGYDLQVPFSVRFTWSGDFVHAAPWSVGSQGFANVSHGCVNLSPGHAQTYYEMSIPGDPVTVSGSPKGGRWDNGWTVWFLSWKQVWKGSALHKAVLVGPDGCTRVRPSSLRSSHAKAPLGRPAPANADPS